jgi:hypothetical protein
LCYQFIGKETFVGYLTLVDNIFLLFMRFKFF